MTVPHFFQFKKFKVEQCADVFQIGTDAILLGALTELRGIQHILEVGCGTGLISLMLAQRSLAQITAIDINASAVSCAQKNFKASIFSERLQALEQDFTCFNHTQSYDLIVCNPPFFETQNLEQVHRNMARNNRYLPMELFFKSASKVLQANGSIWLVLPMEQRMDTVIQAVLQHFFLVQEIVLETGKGLSKRVVLVFSKRCVEGFRSDIFVVRDAEGAYTDAYNRLVSDYLL